MLGTGNRSAVATITKVTILIVILTLLVVLSPAGGAQIVRADSPDHAASAQTIVWARLILTSINASPKVWM